MILLIFVVMGLISVPILLILSKKFTGQTARSMKGSAVISGFFSAMIILLMVVMYLANIGEKSRIEAIYYNNIQNYQTAITETTTYLSQDEFVNQLIAGSIEKIGLTEQIAAQIADWRNTVNAYNIQFNRYKAMSNNIITGIVYPKLPSELRMLTIQTSEQ